MENSDELLDYKTPKAQLIKFVDFKSKKPLIDSTLSRVLDEFRILVKQQEKYLSNGFVDNTNIKFAEDAFFIQSVGTYYGKTVDKLHEDILQHHKRMFISYKFIGKDMKLKEARKQEQDKLEARLNRGKRKKIRLEGPNSIDKKQKKKAASAHNNDKDSKDQFEIFISDHDYLLERPSLILDAGTTLAFEFKIQDENEENELLENSHYNSSENINESDESPYIDESCCDDIPEFHGPGIARLKKAIKSFFERNDKELIPDENLIIAKLRIAYCLRFKFFSDNNINLAKPLEEDLIGYKLYLNDFFRTPEKIELLNMPENSATSEVEMFCKILAAKETLAHETIQSLRRQKKRKLPSVNFQTVILDPLKKTYKGPFDPYLPTGFESDDLDKNENSVPPLLEFIEPGPEREISDQPNELTDQNDHKLSETNLNTGVAEDSELDNDDDNGDNDEEELTEENDQTEKVSDELSENKKENEKVNNKVTEEITKEVSDHSYSRFSNLPQLQIKLTKLDTSVAKDAENDNDDDFINDEEELIENNDKTEEATAGSTYVPPKRRPIRECSKNLSKVFIAAGKSPLNKVDDIQDDDLEYLEDSDDSVSSAKRAYIPNFLDDSDDSEDSDDDLSVLSPKKRRLNGAEDLSASTIPGVKLLEWKNSRSTQNHAEGNEYIDELAELMDIDDEYDEDNENLFETNEEFEYMDEDDDYDSDDEKVTFRKAFKAEKTQNHSSLDRLLSSKINVSEESPEMQIDLGELYEMEKRGLAERVNQWKEFITPKLENIKGKTFSIQQYQSKIIDEINVNKKMKFKEIIRGKSITESIRLFLTTMHLVTLRNLEISGTKPVELCNDTMLLKLLSKEQIQQRLAKYHAPSELNQQERMEKKRTRSLRSRKMKN